MTLLQSTPVVEPPRQRPAPLPAAVAKARAAAERSELIRAVQSVREDGGLQFALGKTTLRRLRRDEVQLLERLGNAAESWNRVLVTDAFDARRVRNSTFHGTVVLGRFDGKATAAPGVGLPTGVYNSVVCDCCVGNNVLVRDVRLLANYVVAEGAVLIDCGSITCEAGTAFGNGRPLECLFGASRL